jgi:hypothetical protein
MLIATWRRGEELLLLPREKSQKARIMIMAKITQEDQSPDIASP